MENYLVINGKRVDLTEEQIEKLGLEIKKKSPFDRVGERKFINAELIGSFAMVTVNITESI